MNHIKHQIKQPHCKRLMKLKLKVKAKDRSWPFFRTRKAKRRGLPWRVYALL